MRPLGIMRLLEHESDECLGIRIRGRVGKRIKEESEGRKYTGQNVKIKLKNLECGSRSYLISGGLSSSFISEKPKIPREYQWLKRKKLYNPKKHYVTIEIPRKGYFYRSVVHFKAPGPGSHQLRRMESDFVPKNEQEIQISRLATSGPKESNFFKKRLKRSRKPKEERKENKSWDTVIPKSTFAEYVRNISFIVDKNDKSDEEEHRSLKWLRRNQVHYVMTSEENLFKKRKNNSNPEKASVGRNLLEGNRRTVSENCLTPKIQKAKIEAKKSPSCTNTVSNADTKKATQGDWAPKLEIQKEKISSEEIKQGDRSEKDSPETQPENSYQAFLKFINSALGNQTTSCLELIPVINTTIDFSSQTKFPIFENMEMMFEPDPYAQPFKLQCIAEEPSEKVAESEDRIKSALVSASEPEFINQSDSHRNIEEFQTSSSAGQIPHSFMDEIDFHTEFQNYITAIDVSKNNLGDNNNENEEFSTEGKGSVATFLDAIYTKSSSSFASAVSDVEEENIFNEKLDVFESETILSETNYKSSEFHMMTEEKPAICLCTRAFDRKCFLINKGQIHKTQKFFRTKWLALLYGLSSKVIIVPNTYIYVKTTLNDKNEKKVGKKIEAKKLKSCPSDVILSVPKKLKIEKSVAETVPSVPLQDLIDVYESVLKENNKIRKNSHNAVKRCLSGCLMNFLEEKLKEKKYKKDLINHFLTNKSPFNFQNIPKKSNSVSLKEYVSMFQKILLSSLSISQISRINNVMSQLRDYSVRNYTLIKDLGEKDKIKTNNKQSMVKSETKTQKINVPDKKNNMNQEKEIEKSVRQTSLVGKKKLKKTHRKVTEKSNLASKEEGMTKIDFNQPADLESVLETCFYPKKDVQSLSKKGDKEEKLLLVVNFNGDKLMVNRMWQFKNEKSLNHSPIDSDGCSELIIENLSKEKLKNTFSKNKKQTICKRSSLCGKISCVEKFLKPGMMKASSRCSLTQSKLEGIPEEINNEGEFTTKELETQVKEKMEIQENSFTKLVTEETQTDTDNTTKREGKEEVCLDQNSVKSEKVEAKTKEKEPKQIPSATQKPFPKNVKKSAKEKNFLKEVLEKTLKETCYSKNLTCDFNQTLWDDLGTKTNLDRIKSCEITPENSIKSSKKQPTKPAEAVKSMIETSLREHSKPLPIFRKKTRKTVADRPYGNYICYPSLNDLQDTKLTKSKKKQKELKDGKFDRKLITKPKEQTVKKDLPNFGKKSEELFKKPSRNNNLRRQKSDIERDGKYIPPETVTPKEEKSIPCTSGVGTTQTTKDDDKLSAKSSTDTILFLNTDITPECCSVEFIFNDKGGCQSVCSGVSSKISGISNDPEGKISFKAVNNAFSRNLPESYSPYVMIHSESFLENIESSAVQNFVKKDVEKFYPGRETDKSDGNTPLVTFVLTPNQYKVSQLPPEYVKVVEKEKAELKDEENSQKQKYDSEELNEQLSLESIEKFIEVLSESNRKNQSQQKKPVKPKSIQKTPQSTPVKNKLDFMPCQRVQAVRILKTNNQKIKNQVKSEGITKEEKNMGNVKEKENIKIEANQSGDKKLNNEKETSIENLSSVDLCQGERGIPQTTNTEKQNLDREKMVSSSLSPEIVEIIKGVINTAENVQSKDKIISMIDKCAESYSNENKEESVESKKEETEETFSVSKSETSSESSRKQKIFKIKIHCYSNPFPMKKPRLSFAEIKEIEPKTELYESLGEFGVNLRRKSSDYFDAEELADGDHNLNFRSSTKETVPEEFFSDEDTKLLSENIKTSEQLLFDIVLKYLEENEIYNGIVLLENVLKNLNEQKSEQQESKKKIQNLLVAIEEKSQNLMSMLENTTWSKILELLDTTLVEGQNLELIRTQLSKTASYLEKIKIIDQSSEHMNLKCLNSESDNLSNIMLKIKDSLADFKSKTVSSWCNQSTKETEKDFSYEIHPTENKFAIPEGLKYEETFQEKQLTPHSVKKEVTRLRLIVDNLINSNSSAEVNEVKNKVINRMMMLEKVLSERNQLEDEENLKKQKETEEIKEIDLEKKMEKKGCSKLIRSLMKVWDTRNFSGTFSNVF